jgi:hypothetical protein
MSHELLISEVISYKHNLEDNTITIRFNIFKEDIAQPTVIVITKPEMVKINKISKDQLVLTILEKTDANT